MLTTHIATEYALYLILHIRFCPLPREFVINGCRCADNCPWRLPDAHLADDIPPWGRTHTPGIWLKLNVGGCFGQAAALSGDAWFHNHGILGCCGPDGMIYDVFELTSTSCEWVVSMLSCAIVSYITPVFFMYIDKGFTGNTRVRCANHGPSLVTTGMEFHNWVMSQLDHVWNVERKRLRRVPRYWSLRA